MGRGKRERGPTSTDRDARRRKLLLAPVLTLLLLGALSSAYLLHLYVKVHTAAPGEQVTSFCAVSDRLNCVTVANSTYSVFLGVPIAAWGLDFFAVALCVVAVSASGRWRLRAWDSLLFVASLLALPACGILAYISHALIHSFCLVCMTIYGTVLLLALILGIAGRRRLGALVALGPKELLGLLRRPAWLLGVLVLLGAVGSQPFWMSRLVNAAPQATVRSAWQGLPTLGQTIGPPGAPLKIEEFTDFQCPHCGVAHTVMMEVLRQFPGKVYLVHRDFPLDMACNPLVKRPFHADACRAAVYARCASRQGKYWPYEELLFANRENLDEDTLRRLAAQVGMEAGPLSRCVADPATQREVSEDIEAGMKRKLTGTPIFFVNGERVEGPRPLSFWEKKMCQLEGHCGKAQQPSSAPAR